MISNINENNSKRNKFFVMPHIHDIAESIAACFNKS